MILNLLLVIIIMKMITPVGVHIIIIIIVVLHSRPMDGAVGLSVAHHLTQVIRYHTIPYNTMKYQETPNLLHYITLEIWNPNNSEGDHTVGRLTIQYHIQYLSVGDQLTQLIVLRSCDPGSFPFNRRTNGRPVTMWPEEKPTVIGLTRSRAVHAITITGRL